ncbi:MAG TPA: hypothetical protein VHZ52_09700 [Acidobacteriaceae bacterium]|jgi:hypothetical protein|nr:hypothetical protein [Acidobacteriaceae bacterium]
MNGLRSIKLTEVGLAGMLGGGVVAGVAALAIALIPGIHRMWPMSGGSTNTPIKVRGGAMTFRYPGDSQGNTQWHSYGTSGWCIPLDTTGGKVKLKIITDPDSDPDSDTSSVETVYTLTGDWVVDLHGRLPDFTSDPSEGIEITPTATCNSNQNGIALTSIDKTQTGFYPSDLPSDGQTYNKRYQRLTCSDEDKCEHMGSVNVTTGGKVKKPVDCENGECIVKIVP